MPWIALVVGVAWFVALTCVVGRARRCPRDMASAALRVAGASGMFAMTTLAIGAGSLAGAVASAACGVALTVDLRAVWVRLTARLRRAQSAMVTPFQNAT